MCTFVNMGKNHLGYFYQSQVLFLLDLFVINMFKMLWRLHILFFQIFVIPVLIGLLFELLVIVPMRVPVDESPVFLLYQDWALGLIFLKIWTRLVSVVSHYVHFHLFIIKIDKLMGLLWHLFAIPSTPWTFTVFRQM